jgi:tetratricopeptide (TPR) repeat protein
VRKIHRLSLLLICSLAFLSMEPTWVTSQGSCGYYWPYHPSIQADYEQHMWDIQTYRFLNYDDEGYYPYDVHANNAPAYSTHTYNTPAYNQSVNNGNATYWLNEANMSYLTGSYAQATESYAKAVTIDPSLSDGWLNLGNSLYYLGKYQASLNAYDALLKLEPQNEDALAGKSLALLALNRTSGFNISTIAPSTVQG